MPIEPADRSLLSFILSARPFVVEQLASPKCVASKWQRWLCVDFVSMVHPGPSTYDSTYKRSQEPWPGSGKRDGKGVHRSHETSNEREARQLKASVERTLALLKKGVLQLPEPVTADVLWQFLRSGGKQHELPEVLRSPSLAEICEAYLVIREKDHVSKSRRNGDRLIVPRESPAKYSDLGIQFDEKGACCRFDLAFLL